MLVAGVVGVALAALPFPHRPAAPAVAAGRSDGAELYQRWCAVCHATDGSGTMAGPSLEKVSIAYLDLTLRTGRMPLADIRQGVRQRTLDDAERRAVVRYLTERLGLHGTVPSPPPGSAASGRAVYAVRCAQCHGAGGGGGLAGDGTRIPPVTGLDGHTIAQAARVGPFTMPPFNEALLTDRELADLATFLSEGHEPPATPLRLSGVDRALVTVFVTLLAFVVVGVAVWAARRPATPPEEGEAP